MSIGLVMKTCKTCGINKPLDEYWSKGRKSDGSVKLGAHCKKCQSLREKGYNKAPRPTYNTEQPVVEEYTCPNCGLTKPINGNFARNTTRKSGVYPLCLECRSIAHKVRTYSISEDKVRTLMANGCQVCGDTHYLAIDHCHKTGKVRGALCVRCNLALGYLGDDILRIMKLGNYLANSMEP